MIEFFLICSSFNLLIFLIFMSDLKMLTEISIFEKSGKDYIIENTKIFILIISIVAIVLGPFLTFFILRNILFTGRPINDPRK